MTHEHAQPERQVPEDQLAFEIQLRDAYVEQFPGNIAVFDEALNDVKRFAGYNIPKYKIVSDEESEGGSPFADNETRAREDGLVDELGYLQSGEEPPFYSFIMLDTPAEYTDEQFDQMTEDEKRVAQYNLSKGGAHIAGELSDASKKLIEDLYDLTGAVVMEVDGRDTLLKGEYHGTPIYFEHSTVTYGSMSTITSLRLMSPRVVEAQLKNPTLEQMKAFSAQTGLTPLEAQNMIRSGELTRDNYQQVAGLFLEARAITDGEVDKMVDETIAQTAPEQPEILPAKRPGKVRRVARKMSKLIGRKTRQQNNDQPNT